MKRPSTRCPASRSSAAETAESTPPESPTTTCATGSAHCLAGFDAVERQLSEQLERMARAPQVVVDRCHHQRAAVLPSAGLELAPVEPERADDGALLDHQETAGILGDCRDGEVELGGHRTIIRRRQAGRRGRTPSAKPIVNRTANRSLKG